MTEVPILLVLGPSGAGKTSLGKWLESEHGWLHLEIDEDAADGIDLHELRTEWNTFVDAGDGQPLAGDLLRRAGVAGAAGIVVTFASGFVLSSTASADAARFGMRVVYLYGTAADCINSFLAREEASGRGLDFDHWSKNNVRLYIVISRPAFAPFRVNVFASDGSRLAWSEVWPRLQGGNGA